MLELRRLFFESGARIHALRTAMEPATTAIIVLDARGTLLQGNAFARALLARADGLRINGTGRLTATDDGCNKRLQAQLRARKEGDVCLIRAARSDGGFPYVLRLWFDLDATTIFISDPERPSGDVSKHLVEALDVTPAVAALVSALLRGEQLQAYAERTGLSVNTAKFHLRSAFQATGTRRQSDLLRLATAITRDLAI